MVSVQLTNQGAALLASSTGPITLGTFELGSAVNYVPAPTDTNIHGSVVFSGVPSTPVTVSANTVMYGVVLDYELGPFYFGELGLFTTGGVLFALVAWSELIQKISSTTSPPGNAITISIYVNVVGQNFSMWIQTAQSNNDFRVAVLASPDLLPQSQQAIPNVYVVSGYSEFSQSPFFAYTDQSSMWQFDAYAFAQESQITVVSSDTMSITVLASEVTSNMIPTYIGQIILEFTNGALFSTCRYVTSVVESGIYATFNFDTAILIQPAVGDLATVFIRQIATTDFVVNPATYTSLGTVQIGTGLTVEIGGSTPGLLSVDYADIPYPVTSVNGLTGAVVLNNTNISGFAAVAYSGEYSALIGAPSPYVLPIGSTSVLGGVKAPSDGNLTINASTGVIDLGFTPVTSVNGETGAVTITPYTLPAATVGTLGGVIVGSGLSVTGGGTLSLNTSGLVTSVSGQTGTVVVSATDNNDASGTTLIVNSGSTTGAIKLKTIVPGTGITLSTDSNGNLEITNSASTYTLPDATTSTLGGVIVGSGISVTAGTISVPVATTSTTGTITVGSGLTITSGVLSVTSPGGVTSFNTRTGAVVLESTDVSGVGGALVGSSNTWTGTNNFTAGNTEVATAIAGTNNTVAASTAFVTSAVATAAAAVKYYDIPGGVAGTYTASQIVLEMVSVRTVTWSANFSSSQGFAGVAPTASATFTIQVNSSTIGTMVFAASATTATFTLTGTASITPGQVLTVLAPATADATLANVTFTLLGVAT